MLSVCPRRAFIISPNSPEPKTETPLQTDDWIYDHDPKKNRWPRVICITKHTSITRSPDKTRAATNTNLVLEEAFLLSVFLVFISAGRRNTTQMKRSLAAEAVPKDQTLPLLSCSSVSNRSHCWRRSFCPSVSAPQASRARRLALRAFWCSPR